MERRLVGQLVEYAEEVFLGGAHAHVAHVHAVLDGPAQPGREYHPSAHQPRSQDLDAVQLAIGGQRAYYAGAGRAVPRYVLVRLGVVDHADGAFAYGDVAADRAAHGRVRGVYAAVYDGDLHALAGAASP